MVLLKEEEKQLLLDRYLDIEWPDDVTDLRCVRCQRVVINHHVSNCQHLFCNNCRRVFSDGGQWKCPQCHQYVTQLDDQDFDVEIAMHKLRIFCPNKKYGCKYGDQLRNIPKHLTTCVDTREAALPVEYTGANRIEDVDKQLTKVSEAIGELSSKFSEQMTTFDDVSSKLRMLTERVNNTEKKSDELELASVKSTEELRSIKSLLKTMNKRIQQIELHHQQTSLNVEEMRIQMASMTQFKKSEELHSLKAETYEWTIKNVAKTILKDHWRIESETFKFTGYPYEIRAKLEKSDEYAVIRLQFKKGNTFNKFLNKNGFTTVKYIVQDQSDIFKKQHIIRESYLTFPDCFGQYTWISGRVLPGVMLCPPYVKDDCIKMTILFEPPSIDRSFVSNNGVLKWRVDNYDALKKAGRYHGNYSPSFYTSPQGYRVKVQLLIDFTRKGFMFVEVLFLTGEHDDSLSIDFPHKTTVTLFNHGRSYGRRTLGPSMNLVKSEQMEDVNHYSFPIESSRLIEENGFVNDDSLLCSVVIEPVISKLSTK